MRALCARLICPLLLSSLAAALPRHDILFGPMWVAAQTSPTRVIERMRSLRRFTTLYVHSDTVYMKSAQMEKALRQRPEFRAWGLQLAASAADCDASLEVKRPFLTFDWTYMLHTCDTGAELARGKVVAWDGSGAALQLAAEIVRRIASARPLPQSPPLPGALYAQSIGAASLGMESAPNSQLLREFQRLYVRSGTVYMKSAIMQNALQARSELQAWGITLVDSPADAETTIEITRPFLTFDWKYNMRAQGVEVGTGKVVAWDGAAAAPQLARMIVERIQSVRGLPAGWEREKRAAVTAAKQWHGKYASGTEKFGRNADLTLQIAPETILIQRAGGAVSLSIPVNRITGNVRVSHTSNVTHPEQGWYQFWDNTPIGDDPGAMVGALALLPIYFGGGALLQAFRQEEHYIYISWEDSRTVRMVILLVAKSDAQSLLAALQEVTARPPDDLQETENRLASELRAEAHNAVPLQLERKMRVGWTELQPGAYQLIFVERQEQRGELYFFSGRQLDLDKVAAQAPVEFERSARDLPQSRVVYREENGISSITELQIPGKTFRFTAVPLPLAAAPET